MSTPIKLQVFTDFVCPWCYLSMPRVARLQAKYEIEIEGTYFPLHPDSPKEGLLLQDLFAGRGFDLDAAHANLKRLMDAEGLEFNARTYTYNSRLAQELAKGFDAVRDALYRAYFEQAKNIGDIEVLAGVAESAGISPDEARQALHDRTFRQAVDLDWEKARRYGITGVPSFVAGHKKVVGAQPFGLLEQLVTAADAKPRTLV